MSQKNVTYPVFIRTSMALCVILFMRHRISIQFVVSFQRMKEIHGFFGICIDFFLRNSLYKSCFEKQPAAIGIVIIYLFLVCQV